MFPFYSPLGFGGTARLTAGMHHKAYIVAGLSDEDLIWLLSLGTLRNLRAGERLVEAGKPIRELFFMVRGAMAIVRDDGTQVATLGEGDVIGEVSFVDPAPASVSVLAQERSELLAVPCHLIAARLDSEPAFAARFYRALAVFLADRLRDTTAVARPDEVAAKATSDRFRRLVGMFRR